FRGFPRDARAMEALLHVFNRGPGPSSGTAQGKHALLVEPAGHGFAQIRSRCEERLYGVGEKSRSALVQARFLDGCQHYFQVDDEWLGHVAPAAVTAPPGNSLPPPYHSVPSGTAACCG